MEYVKIKVLKDTTINELLINLNLGIHRINDLINSGNIKIGKKTLGHHDILKKNQIITIDITKYETIDYTPTKYKIDILYEDDYLLVVNKPYGVIIYDDNSNDTLANYIRNYYLENNINRQIRHVHRLDKETTGCILYAKDVITHSALSKMMEEKTIKRIYRAEVIGKTLKNGIIEKPIGKDRHINNKMIISSSGKYAKTIYKTLEYNKETNTSIVELELKTGRTHQIRVHMDSIGHPLVGDKIYNKNYNGEKLQLISYSISFIHPITMENVDIKV